MANEEKVQRLLRINAQLAERGLRPLADPGDAETFGIELLAISEIYPHAKRFFTDVKFKTRYADGSFGEYMITFGPTGGDLDGAVFTIVVNGLSFVILKQWRPTVGRWCHEAPRGFDRQGRDLGGEERQISEAEVPFGIIDHEVSVATLRAHLQSAHFLGRIAENSGTHATAPAHFLLMLKASGAPMEFESNLRTSKHAKALLWDAQTIRDEIGRRITDNHTLTALALASNYLRRHSPLPFIF